MKFIITIFRDEDGMYIAECPSIPGCISQGKTEKEAEKNIQDAIRECLEVRAEKGIPLTISTRQVEVKV
ncbi:MAG: type II toxin-antitoxin system HicB family antitoxin [Candidatus Hydromicrobium sp.]|jgi:predicted RNase H-like HicB family nuclease|nr:type II toxin-antitoxin system HicB family antitoxin [Actinomycetota bacterium]MBU2563327.1 type II toxin-antitoxin system HicB family antitoxin [Actinomycetota bacterium]MBU4313504.1 type II toxin-antitoxin system HicB family antitoxin [Actinomycetota bacterium]MBU4482746.1 type II toxin-antitoxin system HicB family antitoxin [Actinomycetota bacterium]MCG2790126.1 type II toxin-antitoxin system HicB family antitoxin [Actinomycetes bacterium]